MAITNVAGGFLNSDGGSYGNGFTSSHPSTGVYKIRLNSVPRSAPIVNVTAIDNDYSSQKANNSIPKTFLVNSSQSSTESMITVYVRDSAGTLCDTAFNFTAFHY